MKPRALAIVLIDAAVLIAGIVCAVIGWVTTSMQLAAVGQGVMLLALGIAFFSLAVSSLGSRSQR